MNTWIEQIYARRQRVAVPVMTHPGIEALGYRVVDAVTDGKKHYEAIRYLADHYPSYACSTIMDLTVEAEAFGCRIDFPENEVPSVVGRLVCDEASVEALAVPELSAGRVPEFLTAARMAVGNIADRPVLAGCIGPFSLAGRLYDMSEIMVAIYMEPEVILRLLDKCTDFILKYCAELKRIGVAGVFMAEPAAGLLSNEDCMTYSTVFVRKVVEQLQDDHFTVVLHNCGNTGQCTQAMVESGAAALHFGNAVDMLQVLGECPADTLVMGNIDPVGIMRQASPEVVKQVTLKLLQDTSAYPNFVLSTGCDVPPLIPEENINVFFEALDEYNASR